jgi:tripeptide aminopeptidase
MRILTMKAILFLSLNLLLVAPTQAQLRPPREDAVSRFLRYVQINTQSEQGTSTIPSTKNQMQLANLLARELESLGAQRVRVSEFGFVYATIPNNLPGNSGVPAIGLLAHMDTSPEVSGANVKPIMHKNYGGGDIVLPGDSSQAITVEKNPTLREMIGDDVITADGTTLLGSDDKAGCAAIMTLVDLLLQNPQIKHGTIAIGFTPDEEVGGAIEKFDIEGFGAKYAFTVDGGPLGRITNETWNARRVSVTFKGHNVHPGSAKGVMVNSHYAFAAFISRLPIEQRAESTEGRQGFMHPYVGSATVGQSSVRIYLRDYEKAGLDQKEVLLRKMAQEIEREYPGVIISLAVEEQYQNMIEVLKNHQDLTANAMEAASRAGLRPELVALRGGTDGATLSFRGLPCPNLFTGGFNAHSKHEFNSRGGLEKTTETLLNLVQIFAEKR